MASFGAKPVSIPLEEGMRTALDGVEHSLGRDRSRVMRLTLGEYLAVEAWRVEHIKRAMAQADAGDFATDKEVEPVFAKRGAKFG